MFARDKGVYSFSYFQIITWIHNFKVGFASGVTSKQIQTKITNNGLGNYLNFFEFWITKPILMNPLLLAGESLFVLFLFILSTWYFSWYYPHFFSLFIHVLFRRKPPYECSSPSWRYLMCTLLLSVLHISTERVLFVLKTILGFQYEYKGLIGLRKYNH